MSSATEALASLDSSTARSTKGLSAGDLPPVLRWALQMCIGVVGATFIASHRPGAVLHPQFWAEDGGVFYAQAYNFGGVQAIIIPVAGYIMLLQRLVALASLAVPMTSAPLVFVLAALAAQVAPLVFLFSPRLDGVVPSMGVRSILAFLYVAYPNAFYLRDAMTNTQWFLVVLMFLIVIADPPTTRTGQWFDIVTLAVLGLSGPLGLLLVPVAFLRWRETRSPWTLLELKIIGITATVEALALCLTATVLNGRLPPPTPTRVPHVLGPTVDSLTHLLSGQVILGSLLGARGFGVVFETSIWAGMLFPLLILVGGLALALVAVREAPSPVGLFLLLGALIVAASLAMPVTGQAVSDPVPAWLYMSQPGHTLRYEVVLGLGWLTVLVWLAAQNRRRWLRRVATVLLGASLVAGIPLSWNVPAVGDLHFGAYVAQFEQLPPGKSITIPLPPAWKMTLTKHGR